MPQPAEQQLTHFIYRHPPPDPYRHRPRRTSGKAQAAHAAERRQRPHHGCRADAGDTGSASLLIAEGAIGVHRSSRSNAFLERCAPEVTPLKGCPVHTNPLVKAVTLRPKGSVPRSHPLPRDASKPVGSQKATDQGFRRSEAVSWAWEDLNLRPPAHRG